MQSHFHVIRVFANKARHVPDFPLTVSHARIALDSFLTLLEWYYCKFKDNPVTAIYAEKPNRALLPSPPFAWVPLLLVALVSFALLALLVATLAGFLPTA